MDKKSRALIVSFCLLASGTAMANDAVWGALLGGGAGAALGGSVSGRNGAIVGGALGAAAGAVIASETNGRRLEYVAAPVYRPATVYYAEQPVYYPQPMRVAPPTVYYVTTERGRPYKHHHAERYQNDEHWHGYR